jgi:hypothetical protein
LVFLRFLHDLTLFFSVWQAYRDKEERLVATAFYDLGMKLNRGSVEGRLANLSQVRYRENRMWIRDRSILYLFLRWLLYVYPLLKCTLVHTCPRDPLAYVG